MNKMRLAGVNFETKTGAPWITTELFFHGCLKNCPGCFNHLAREWDAPYREFTVDELYELMQKQVPYKRITFSGGEPMIQATLVGELASKLKEAGFTLLCYTGYTLQELVEDKIPELDHQGVMKLLQNIDVLVDGEFEMDKVLEISDFRFVGSRNQRIIDMPATIANGYEVVLYEHDTPA